VASWTTPTAHWEPPVNSASHSKWLVEHGELLGRWDPAPFETSPTDYYRVDAAYWLWQAGVGGLRFSADAPAYFACPCEGADLAWFRQVVTRSWLPAIYQVWGRQVLHASAVMSVARSEVTAFVGPSGAGKSTLAYGLGLREGWRMVADDTLAFAVASGSVSLFPLRQEVRLRAPTAAHYGKTGETFETLSWPSQTVSLARLYFLRPDVALDATTRIAPMSAAESYRLVLEQAFALSLNIPEHNRDLMLDYVALAAAPAFQLTYQPSFDVFDRVLDEVEAHAGV
jgi:hypothetical protein